LEAFSTTLWEEVDYLAEAGNAARFQHMYREDERVRIPAVYIEHTTMDVLTLEDVYFIKITDYPEIEAAGVDRAEVAERLFRTYLRQIFVEGFFHADPHPGNLFVEPHPGEGWRLVFVDFGMVGSVGAETKAGLRDLAVAVGVRDLDRLMRAYAQLGVLLPEADLGRIREAEAAIMGRIWGKSMRELVRTHPQEMRAFAKEFRDVLYEMPFQVPTNLLYLGRCVAILSGMCTGLDPDFNLFQGLAPFARDLIADEGGDWLDESLDMLIESGRALIQLPLQIDRTLTKVTLGELGVVVKPAPELDRQLRGLKHAADRLGVAVIGAAALLAGSLFYVNGERSLALGSFGVAGLFALWMLFARTRD
jgi:predicted unusual protein kinase regulating ubiquinone biosynthesis (AarF/ABC1/UbiB family)